MFEVTIKYPTPDGYCDYKITAEKTSFGRGSDADLRFADTGMSRLHATIYREGERIWIVDENSANGTYVNGARVAAAGTPLRDGDTILLGTNTTVKIQFLRQPNIVTPQQSVASAATSSNGLTLSKILPALLLGLALTIVVVSVTFVVIRLFARPAETAEGTDEPEIAVTEKTKSRDNVTDPTPKSTTAADSTPEAESIKETVAKSAIKSGQPAFSMPAGKKYLDLSDSERRQYIADRAMRIAQIIGNSSSEPIPPEAIEKIKAFTDAYAKRISVKPLGGCRFGDNLQATYERASKNAPFIIKAFNEKGTDPRIGIYLAMIESEHCVCLQSPTGPLGMFQFTFATAKLHFVPNDGIVKTASTTAPDDRCKPEMAARAAASYMKALTGRFGTGPASVPLAIGSYNSGEGGLSANLQKALDTNSGLPRDFWTLIANGEKLSKQFQSENFKYVPKFFAAAIVGENPQDFGLTLRPISTYSQ
jgi:pSer/pThr/pTyr-binding forkhead associated (FHA) protein